MRACAAYGGLGGTVPSDFPDIDLCRDYKIKLWKLGKAPAMYIERIRFREAVRRQSELDRAENEKE